MIDISIHALLAESDNGFAGVLFLIDISIHALLAESDFACCGRQQIFYYFYPRSPCGERPLAIFGIRSSNNFYPRSPCGERPPQGCSCYLDNIISIHALLAESDTL